MMLKASSNKLPAARRMFFHTLGRTVGLTVLVTLAALLICPMYAFTVINRSYGETDIVFNIDTVAPEALLIAAIASLAAVLLYVFINFSYLYSRSSSDFFHSLPITRSGLLCSRLLASILPVLLPLTLTYASLCALGLLPFAQCSVKLVLTGYAYNLLALVALTGFSLIFIICAGSVFELLLSFATVNIGVVIIQIVFCDFCADFLRGFSYSDYAEQFAVSASPYLYFFNNFYKLLKGELAATAAIAFVLKLVLLAAISYLAAFLLYRHRKSERSGMGYAYGFMYTASLLIVSCVCAVALGMIFSEGEITAEFWIFAAIGAVLSAVAFAAVRDRGFKQFKKSALMGGVSAALLGLAALVLVTDCLGYGTRVPAAERVESVSVEFSDVELTLKDPTDALKLHREIIEEPQYNSGYTYIRFDYLLKNGEHLKRFYITDNGDHTELLLKLYTSDERIEEIKREIKSIKTNAYISQYLNFTDGEAAATEDTYEEINNEIAVSAEQLEAFVNAYISDVSKTTEKSISDENAITYYINGVDENMKYVGFHLRVEQSFENTLKAAEELGFCTDLP